MIVTVPPRLQSFCARFGKALSDTRRAALAWLLAGFLLTREKRTQSAIGRAVLSEERTPGSVSRRMRRGSFGTRDLVRAEAQRQIAREIKRAGGKKETWFLTDDGVCLQRGSATKIENAIQYKKKGKGRKGRSTKAHTFVMGVLITASGARIPLPRRSYYTQKYVNRQNRLRKEGRRRGKPLVYKSHQDLACLIIKELDLPDNMTLVVVADQAFEGKKITKLCRKKGYAFIAPAGSQRTFEPGRTLHARGKALPHSAYRKLILRRGEEDTASHRRHTPRGAGEKDRRVYRYHCERRTVAQIGEVAVVYSWKRRRDRSGRLTARETFKVLVCSDPELLGEKCTEKIGAMIVEFFEMRWPVEVFFRELKSGLGLSDYRGTDFRAFERHVDLVLLSFMFLEEMRTQEMVRTRSPVRRRELAGLRTSGMKARLAREAHAADVSWIVGLAEGPKGCSHVKRLLPSLAIAA
jgi:SRSO17 transposase